MNLYTSKSEKAAKEGFAAAGRGDFPAVKRLIDSSFNIGDCDEEGSSLLHYAVKGGNPELIRYLAERCGMDPAWANREGVTPYDLAQRSCEEEAAGGSAREICGEETAGVPARGNAPTRPWKRYEDILSVSAASPMRRATATR